MTARSAKVIAKYFIWKASKEGKKISNKKLQKLLYYAQAWNLVFHYTPLFNDDIVAWILGPTVRSVYNQFKKLGFNPISITVDKKEIEALKDDKVLNDVWEVYGKYDADYLETLTHSEEPWQIAREETEYDEISSNIITLDSMREYYSKRLGAIK